MHKTTGEDWESFEISFSGANHAVLHAQNDRWSLGPIETINSGHIVAVWVHKTTDEGCDP